MMNVNLIDILLGVDLLKAVSESRLGIRPRIDAEDLSFDSPVDDERTFIDNRLGPHVSDDRENDRIAVRLLNSLVRRQSERRFERNGRAEDRRSILISLARVRSYLNTLRIEEF